MDHRANNHRDNDTLRALQVLFIGLIVYKKVTSNMTKTANDGIFF